MTSEDACDKTDPANLPHIHNYQTVIGALLYLSSNTRPDIAFAVNQCARFMSCPGLSHLYVTKTLKIVYLRGMSKPNTLEGFIDADHAGNPEDRISVLHSTGVSTSTPGCFVFVSLCLLECCFFQKVATVQNIADIFTKRLSGPLLEGHRSFFLW